MKTCATLNVETSFPTLDERAGHRPLAEIMLWMGI